MALNRTIIPFVLFLLYPCTLYAATCDLEVRKGHAVEDIRNALHCLDSRIKDLEANIHYLTGRIQSTSRINNPSTFNAGAFSVSVRGTSMDNNYIYVSMYIQSETTEVLMLALDNGREPVIINELNGRAKKYDGYPKGIVDNCENCGSAFNQSKYTPVPANSSLPISLAFRTEGLGVSSGISQAYSLNITVLRLKANRVFRITVPLTTIVN